MGDFCGNVSFWERNSSSTGPLSCTMLPGSSTLPRLKKQQKSLAVSPLATKDTRAPLETRTHPTHTTGPPQTHSRATSTAITHTPRTSVTATSPPSHGKPTTGGDTSRRVEDNSHSRFFAHGMGTQLMLASASSQAEQLLLDRARRLLGSREVEALLKRLNKVGSLLS